MNFQTFINSLYNCYNNLLNYISSIFNIIIENNYFKLIIYITIIAIIVFIYETIYGYFFKIISYRKTMEDKEYSRFVKNHTIDRINDYNIRKIKQSFKK